MSVLLGPHWAPNSSSSLGEIFKYAKLKGGYPAEVGLMVIQTSGHSGAGFSLPLPSGPLVPGVMVQSSRRVKGRDVVKGKLLNNFFMIENEWN